MTDVSEENVYPASVTKLIEVREYSIVSADGDSRPLGSVKHVERSLISFARETRLPDADSRKSEGSDDSGPRYRLVFALCSVLLFVASAIFIQEGITNIYDGPNDWYGLVTLLIAFLPFCAGFLLVVFCVFPA